MQCCYIFSEVRILLSCEEYISIWFGFLLPVPLISHLRFSLLTNNKQRSCTEPKVMDGILFSRRAKHDDSAQRQPATTIHCKSFDELECHIINNT